ncbi:MAG: EAL domain-containing protein [Rhizobiaceae bacterium]
MISSAVIPGQIMRKPLQIVRNRALQAILVLALIFTGIFVAQVVHSGFVYQRNVVQLAEMNSRLLRSAELALDYAIITLGDADLAKLTQCTTDSVRSIRERIIRRGSIKEIEVRRPNGTLVCAGLGLRDELISQSGEQSEAYPARNDSIRLSMVSREGGGLLRVSWQQSSVLAIDAIINLDTILFDVFPPALREDAEAVVRLAGGEVIARYTPDNGSEADTGRRSAHFEDSSWRYPVSSSLMVAPPAIANWNASASLAALGLGGLLGGIIGTFLTRQIFRPADPVNTLRTAIQRREIHPHFQPIFSLKDTAIVGCEVLMRWIPPGGTVIPPDRFIPFAESSGLIVPMTETIVRDALSRIKPLLLERPDFKIAFNVTPAHFETDTFATVFRGLVAESGISPRQVVIELTERQSFEHAERAARIAAELRSLGFRIALDDMGAGHNGLSQVHELPIDIIKIDKKFVDLIGIDQAATTIVQMITNLAADLGKTTVAEGIETDAQLQKLRRCGVDQGQGYLVSPPLSGLDFLAYVEGKSHRPKGKELRKVALSAA